MLLLIGAIIMILILTFKIKPVTPVPCPSDVQSSEQNPYIVYEEN